MRVYGVGFTSAPRKAKPITVASGPLCAVQAHWGWLQAAENYGLPPALDPLEGWIVSA